jgi:hypothetical protein
LSCHRRERAVAHVRQGGAAPESESSGERPFCSGSVTPLERATAAADQFVEMEGVDLFCGNVEPVARSASNQDTRPAFDLQHPTEPGHVRLDRVAGGSWRRAPPQVVDELADHDNTSSVEGEISEDAPLARPAECPGGPVDYHLGCPQHPEVHGFLLWSWGNGAKTSQHRC